MALGALFSSKYYPNYSDYFLEKGGGLIDVSNLLSTNASNVSLLFTYVLLYNLYICSEFKVFHGTTLTFSFITNCVI